MPIRQSTKPPPHPTYWAARFLSVQRTLHPKARLIEHMGIDHGRRHILMPQEFLNSSDVVSILEQMGREGMAKSVARRRLLNTRSDHGLLYRQLQRALVDVVTPPL